MKIEDLGLSPVALAGARLLQAKHPEVEFTSGRRDVPGQASAMASNIIHNRRWIEETYVSTGPSRELQAWVDAHPQAVTQDQIAAGLEAIMASWTDAQKAALSKHFSGDAFDVEPVSGPAGAAILATLERLPGVKKVLTKEGGLVRWHAQFA